MRRLLPAIVGLFLFGCPGGASNRPPPECTPRCEGRVCGVDGCGGLCGTCGAGQACSLEGQCIEACTPNCSGRECGDDGCGGSCGSCSPELTCGMDGRCFLCTPDCTGRECGDDGCGGSCGSCPVAGDVCANGTCCTPSCTGAQCGDDGCGGSCGECPAGMICGANRACEVCTPSCTGRQCGDDGCGGSCGDCGENQICDGNSGQCCTPNCTGRECGDDGCGGSCGACDDREMCNAQGQCEGCMRDCTGLECSTDGCCGSCLEGLSCLPSGLCSCADTCTPDCSDKACGPDECGGSCGTCPANTACRLDPTRSPAWQCDPFAAPSPMMSFFVTSTGSMMNGGNLGGISAADDKCRQLAEAAGVMGKTWRAYLSDMAGGIAARDRIGTGPWFNAYGESIVSCNPTCIEALHTEGLTSKVIVDENGTHVDPGFEHDIWTGSNPDGTPSGDDCRGWTSSSVDDNGTVGHSDGQRNQPDDTPWNSAHGVGCDFFSITCTLGRGHIYCFAID